MLSVKRWAVIFVIFIHIILLSCLSFSDSPTNIEIAHLPSGLSHWEHGTFYYFKQNPPLVRLIASFPIQFIPHKTNWQAYSEDKRLRCELAVGTDFLEANQGKIRLFYGFARLACIPFSVLGALVCFLWSKELFGYAAGLIAMILWCFSPMILGHGHLLNPDMAAAAMGVTATYTFRNWLKSQTFNNAIIAGIFCGLCILTKSTWIFLLILFPLIYIIFTLLRFQNKINPFIKAKWLQPGIILLLAVFLLNLIYGFEGSFRLLKNYQFVSKTLSGNDPLPSGSLKLGNRFKDSLLGFIPVPFPNYFIEGLDVQKSDFERPWDSYLNNEWKKGGWWYYYFYGLIVKTPESTLVLFLISIILALLFRQFRLSVSESILILLPCILIIGICTIQKNMSVHYRYIIPAFPFIYIFISRIGIVFQNKNLFPKIVIVILCGCSVIISLLNYPQYISYFNLASGGSNNGYRHMQGCSLDWGQDSYRLKQWQEEHQDAKPFFIALYSYVKPEWLEIDGKPIVQMVQQTEDFDPESLESGWFAISRCHTYGNELNFSFFEAFTPITTIGNTIDIFHLSEDDVSWFKNQTCIYNALLVNLQKSHEMKNRIKVAVYCHDETDTSNINQITNILNEVSGFQTTLINAKEIKSGKLSNCDVILFPGGSGTATKELIGQEGLDQINQFVCSGGGYVGICGGAYLASGGYGLEFINVRASLEDVIENGKTVSMAERGFGYAEMKINRIGHQLFINTPVLSRVFFSGGPVFTSLIGKRNDILVLASYESEFCQYDCQKGSMLHSPAIVANHIGKGLCISISPHPESSEELSSIISDSVRMVTSCQLIRFKPGDEKKDNW